MGRVSGWSEYVQARDQTAAVVQDADGGMGALLRVCEKTQVHAPSVVHHDHARGRGLDLATQISSACLW
jgi:hypothetical protein